MYNDIEAVSDNDAVIDKVLADLRTIKWRNAARKRMWTNRISYWFAMSIMLWGACGAAYLLNLVPATTIPLLAVLAAVMFVFIGLVQYRMPD